MRRLTIKGFKTAGFLLKAAASGIESLLEETYPVLREGAKRIGLSPKDFTHIEISNKAFNEATSKAFIHSARSRILQITSMDSSTGSVSAGRKQMKILSRIFFTSRKS